jgi:eukaryotic-like serine/threonine-protein kinase
MSLSNGSMLGFRYQLEHRIGSGGYSEVWRAHDTVLDRPVAIKLLHSHRAGSEEALLRFRNEAQLAGRLSHVNVARVYDFCDSGQEIPPYLVMELIDGPSLSQVIDHGPLRPARTMDILAQAASGLQAAHSAGLVHRDVKPANFMLAPGGVIKITDFGLSHTLGSAPITRTGLVIGTPSYIAPERAGGARATPAGDLYSLGVVGYECLAGDVPFTGSPLEVAAAHREREFPPLPASVPPAIAQFIARLTAKDPAARPASAEETAQLATQLRDQQAGLPTAGQDSQLAAAPWLSAVSGLGPGVPGEAGAKHPTVVTELPPAGPGRHVPRRRAGLVAAGVVALAIAIAAGVALAQGGSQPAAKPTADAHTSAPAVRLVDVQRAALIGQPTQVAVRQLRAEGFKVRVQLEQTFSEAPGQVIAVHPAGPLPAGSLVTIVASAWPSGFGFGHHHHHHFGGNGFGNGGNGNGNGGGGNGNGGNGFIGNVLNG